ncbi:hypothetical protein COL26b_006075 [Colletotrichum chrysophilum]|uniref:uncharacterized protein n=1 Tax=Colletotrichum chrysophilum TaxID=1836956 RepID=UPI0023010D92|nr:uncharacterized protein COL26b_006075 [Colletotrichum chrysophilum]KAJ0375753.1 hypothetical protein COL26b_006075 [Colletotrichum chrysophilum]
MESTDIIASIIASVETISLSYGRFNRIEGFPRAFTEVAHALLLVEEILPLLQQGIKSQSSHWHNDDFIVKSLNDGLSECLELASSMCSIIRDITAVQDSGINKWSGIIHSYRQKVASIGKGHNIETLMLNLLVGLRKVFLNDSITKDFALPEQDAKLENAYKSLTAFYHKIRLSQGLCRKYKLGVFQALCREFRFFQGFRRKYKFVLFQGLCHKFKLLQAPYNKARA